MLAGGRGAHRRGAFLQPGLPARYTKPVCRLLPRRAAPAFDRLMLELDEPAMKSLLVELDESEQAKAAALGDPPALLEELINKPLSKGGGKAASRPNSGAARRTAGPQPRKSPAASDMSARNEAGRVFPSPRTGKDAKDRAIHRATPRIASRMTDRTVKDTQCAAARRKKE